MKWQDKEHIDRMALFHNRLVGLVDECNLEPQEVIVTLRMVAGNIEKLFETSVKAPKEEKPDDS